MAKADDLPVFQTKRHHPEMTMDKAETATSSQPSGSDDGSHLDAIQMPDIETDFQDQDGPLEVGEDGQIIDNSPPEQISRDAFFTVFCTAFDLPGQIMRDFKPLGIQPDEKDGARAASDAAYSLLEIYYPSALMPQSETLAHLLILGPFLMGKAMVVRHILAARSAKPVEVPKETSTDVQGADRGDVVGDPGVQDWHIAGQPA